MRRILMVAVAGSLLASACSSSSMTLTDYAAEVDRLVRVMNQRIDDGDAAVAVNPSLERAQAYALDRIGARDDFNEAFSALSPPDEVADLHASALDIMGRLAAAEGELVEMVLEADSLEEASAVWDSPPGRLARALDEEAVALCAAAQADLDATEQRAAFADTPWIPPEMKEVVRVTFRCDEQAG